MTKKILAMILAVMMVMAMSVAAFADNNGDVYQDDSLTAVNTTNNTIPLKKSIIMYNINGSDVYEPHIVYTYTVAPVTDAALLGHVTDDGEYNSNVPVTAKVNAGVVNGVIFAGTDNTISFDPSNTIVTTSATGVEVEYGTNLTVDLSKFTHAGIYRYLITEADNSAAVTAAGMDRPSGYSSERYLDVYLSNGGTVDATTNPAGLQLTGAVIFRTDAQDTSTPTANNATTQITTTTYKTTGFEPSVTGDTTSSTPDYSSDTLADHYTTYDIKVTKSVTGAMGDKTHDFPFYVTITNTITGAKYTYVTKLSDASSETSTAETVASATITKGADDASSTLKLRDGNYVTFIGVPTNKTVDGSGNLTSPLTIEIHEYNDSVDKYVAGVADSAGASISVVETNGDSTVTTGEMNATTGSADFSTLNLTANDATTRTVTVTNNLPQISPTGLVLRFAPYIAMLVAGVALFLIMASRRRRNEDED